MLKKIIVLIIVLFISIKYVSAYELEYIEIEDYYVLYNDFKCNANMFKIKETVEVVFSLKPYKDVDNYKLDSRYIDNNVLSEINKDLKNDMQDLLYLGYGYKNHTEEKWYLLTQYLLWNLLGYKVDIVDAQNRSIKDIYKEEYLEYLDLIDKLHTIPSYFSKTIDMNYGEEYLLRDIYGVEDNFVLLLYLFLEVKAKNNSNYLESDRPHQGTLGCYYKDHPASYNKIYYTKDKIFINNTTSSKRVFEVKVNVHGGKIKIIRLDENNNPIEKEFFGLYNSSNKLIERMVTNKDGEAVSSYIPVDNYYLLSKDQTRKIDVEFIDYSTTEVIIKDEKIIDDVLEDKEATDEPEIKEPEFNDDQIELEQNTEDFSSLNDNISKDILIENENQELPKEIFNIPNTKFDITKLIVLSILLFVIAIKWFIKR